MTTLSLFQALTHFKAWRTQAAGCRLAGPELVTLAHGELRRALLRPGQGVHCLRGWLWITADGEGVDHEIGPGDVYVPYGGAAVVIAALEDARYRMGAVGIGDPRRAHEGP